MISYNFDLFSDAKDYFNSAMISISLLENLISKFQSCSLPKTVSSSTISGIVSNCNSIKDNSANLQTIFDDISSAIDETEGLQQEYAEVIGDIELLEKEQKNFDISSLGGWTVDSELTNDIETQLEEKYALKKELEEKLGIEVDDRKWYEALWDSIVEQNEDWENVCELQKKAQAETGSDTSAKAAYLAASMEYSNRTSANSTVIVSNILRSIGNVGEKILDFATQALGWLTATAYKNPQSHMSPYMMYAQENNLPFSQPKEIQDATKAIVTKNVVDDWYNSFYRDNVLGKNINAEAYTKYDDPFSVGLNKGVQGVVETGVVIAASVLGTPATGAALAAGFETAVKGGEAVTRAYDNGATFDEATGYMAAEGAIYGATTYLGSTYFTNMISKGGTFIPTQTIDDALKATFRFSKYNPALKRLFLGTLLPASIPVVDSVSEWATWNSEETLTDVWNKNNTTEKAIFAGVTGLGLTTGSEVFGSLLQGKYLKNSLKEMYPTLSESEINKIVDNTYFLSGKEYLELNPANKMIEGGYNQNGKSYINLDTTGFKNIDNVIENVYHENTHSIGTLKIKDLITKGYSTRGFNESVTDLLAIRASGRPSGAYNQEAIKLLDSIEGALDPSKNLLKNFYLYGDPETILTALRKKGNISSEDAEYILMGIADSLQVAIDGGAYRRGVGQLQSIYDMYLLGG